MCFNCLFDGVYNAKVDPKIYLAFAYNSLLSSSNKTSEDQGKKFICNLYQAIQKYENVEPSFDEDDDSISDKENQKIKYESYKPTASKTHNNIYRILPR